MKIKNLLSAFVMLLAVAACNTGEAKSIANETKNMESDNKTTNPVDTNDVKVLVKTTLGDFTILLYGDTPNHRDNFVELVNDGTYEGLLFHRVIDQFMVQAGDPDSKTAAPGQALGAGDLGYTIPAEIVYPKHFNKRGALCAARTGDAVNPEKRSSASQFYIVTGRTYDDKRLATLEQQMLNDYMQKVFGRLAQQHMDEIRKMQAAQDTTGLKKLQDELIAETEAIAAQDSPSLTDAQKEAYRTVGGAPHLDGDYTVYGEVIDGMETIDKIEKVPTDGRDRPKEDVKIISMKVIK
jgi:cyclophilin family peptidyl-prolyl cis-trans isomerase